MGLTFNALSKANRERCHEVYHLIDEWTPTDWACAMGGECGEALNEVKKLRRWFDDPDDFRRWSSEDYQNHKQYAADASLIAAEVADMVIYADLLCQRLGISLEDAIREKFNAVSEERGSDVRL